MFPTRRSSLRSDSMSPIPSDPPPPEKQAVIVATKNTHVKRAARLPASQDSGQKPGATKQRHKESLWILADNLRRIVGNQSVRSWAGPQDIPKNQSLARNVSRLIRGSKDARSHCPTIEQLDRIAERCGNLQAWHLLMPGLDPANPPVLSLTATEVDLYTRLRDAAVNLPVSQQPTRDWIDRE